MNINSQILGLRVASIIFRTDKLSAVAALGDRTRGACCWTPDAALAKRDCLRDIRLPGYLAVDASRTAPR
jgi:hypothetical protein